MRFRLSINRTCYGKDKSTIGNDSWEPVDLSVSEFVQLHYIDGVAIAAGLYDNGPLGPDERTHKNDAHWTGAQVLVVDVDEWQPGREDSNLLDDPTIARHCIAAIPSSSYTEATPKVHMYFALDSEVTNANTWRMLATYVSGRLPIIADPSMNVPAQGTFGTVFKKPSMKAHKKAIDDGLVYVNENAQPLSVEKLRRAVFEITARNASLNPALAGKLAALHRDAEGISRRAELFLEQPPAVRRRVALDALTWVVSEWGRRAYEDWLQLVMSAHTATDGSNAARDIIAGSSGVEWSRGEKAAFKRWWANYTRRGDGYTVATLFMLARKAGWLSRTRLEIPASDVEHFHATDVGDWLMSLPELPKRALIQSGTGSGKTLGMIRALKRTGDKAVFLAPSIKLCTALSATLTENGVENTLYIDKGTTKDADTLARADVLVTTLQTFAVKLVQRGIDLGSYKMAFIDESDELFGAFARADTGRAVGYPSHVSRIQSQWGMYALSRIFREVDHVIMSDGTATMVTVETARRLCPPEEPLRIFRNAWKRDKATVQLVPSIYDARKIAIDAAEAGQRVVVAVDTKREAQLLGLYLRYAGAVADDELLVITGETHHISAVQEFFMDVEAGAKRYRVIIYNSAMGSGVSIVQTEPDVLVQIATHVSPRKNLQILNRYRKQGNVYCYVLPTESLYGETAERRIARLEAVTASEVQLTGVELQERTDVAELITDIAKLSIQDEHEQTRSIVDMYVGLLRDDGRRVVYYQGGDLDEGFADLFKQATAELAKRREAVMKGWRDVPPISRDDPPDDSWTATEVAQGLLHAYILNVVPDYESVADINDEELAALVLRYGKHVRLAEYWLRPESILDRTIEELTNRRRARVTFRLYMSRLELISIIGLLFPDTDAVINEGRFQEVGSRFVREVELREQVYNTVASRARNHLEQVRHRKGTDAEVAYDLARHILGSMGLKVKRRNGKRIGDSERRERVIKVEGADGLLRLVRMRGGSAERLEFNPDRVAALSAEARKTAQMFNNLSSDQQARVCQALKDVSLTFDDAVSDVINTRF